MSSTSENHHLDAVRFDRTPKAIRQSQLSNARDDVVSGLMLWPLWLQLGWNDILQRYRRSFLGPFWLTTSMAIMVIALGILYATIFQTPIHDFLPFLCVGMLLWAFLSSFFLDGGVLFVGAETYIKQIRLPYSVYLYRSCWSKLVIFLHNFVIYFGVLIYFQVWPGMAGLLALPGFLLLLINGALVTLCIGIVSARFRDIPQIVNSLVQIVFFVTPIMWKPDLLHDRIYIVSINPFFHLIEIVRLPLLGGVPSLENYLAVGVITIINLAVCAVLFVRFRSRIAYWV